MKLQKPDFQFWPEAMLPAWLVTDRDLVVKRRNNFAFELLAAVGKGNLFFNDLLSLSLSNLPSERHESLWHCILDPSYSHNLDYIKAALEVMEEHVTILDNFDGPAEADVLVDRLKRVNVHNGDHAVTPYIYRPLADSAISEDIEIPEFVMGIKISPPEGLKLIRPVGLENSVVEYVDIVMAYRLNSDWTFDRKLRRVNFLGTQPAIHDATVRHGLWEKTKEEEQAQITQFLSHALKTPIANIQSMVADLQDAEVGEYYKEVCRELESNVKDLSNLTNLILFINNSEIIPTSLHSSLPSEAIVPQTVTIDEIHEEIAKTLQSIINGRTRDPADKTKALLLIGSSSSGFERKVGFADCVDAVRGLVDGQDLNGIERFYLVTEFQNESEKFARDIATNVKTTFLNLLLSELVLNAIKYADVQAPIVSIKLSINKDRFEIHVSNNGKKLLQSEVNKPLSELASKHGEKRKALGLSLNKRAARILNWELEWRQPAYEGTHLVLSIPFKD
jgi:signal transduction histidine kinase